jgi:hypothetical protein
MIVDWKPPDSHSSPTPVPARPVSAPPLPHTPARLAPAPRDEDDTWDQRPVVLGIAACLVAGAALIAASIEATVVLTRPLAGLGVLLGVVGSVAAFRHEEPRASLPVCGAIACLLVLTIAVFMPGILGPSYEASQQDSDYDPEAIRPVPLTLTVSGSLETDGYADASRAALLQGTVRVQITSVTIAPVRVLGVGTRYSKKPYLAVAIRVQHLGHGPMVEFRHWGTTIERNVPTAKATVAGLSLTPSSLFPDIPADVNDGARLFPNRAISDVILFEAPSTSGPVRIEMPAEAWEGKGVLRFEIPRSMIVDRRTRRP